MYRTGLSSESGGVSVANREGFDSSTGGAPQKSIWQKNPICFTRDMSAGGLIVLPSLSDEFSDFPATSFIRDNLSALIFQVVFRGRTLHVE
jgi:hypothetical protein